MAVRSLRHKDSLDNLHKTMGLHDLKVIETLKHTKPSSENDLLTNSERM